MAERFYILPMVERAGHWLPQYLSGLSAVTPRIRWLGTDPPSCLVCVDELAEIEKGHEKDPLVLVLSRLQDVDSPIDQELGVVRDGLRCLNLPVKDLSKEMSYRELLRSLVAMMRFSQRYRYRLVGDSDGTEIFPAGITPQTPINQLSPSRRAALLQACLDLHVDISAAHTLQDALWLAVKENGGKFEMGIATV